MKQKNLLFLLTFFSWITFCMENKNTPFSYNIDIKTIPSSSKENIVTICCHGYGGNNSVADLIHSYQIFDHDVVSFNFPDHDITKEVDHNQSVYGTIDEILPLLYEFC